MNNPVNCTASELSIFLQALAADCLPITSSDTIPSVPSKLTPIASKVSQQGNQTVHFPGFQSLIMCKTSTASRGADSLMPSAVDFLARTSALQAKAQELKANTQVYGENSPGYLAKYDQSSHSLKTAQGSLFLDSTACLQTLPRSGSMFNGVVYQQPKSVLTMGEIVCGLLPSSRRPSYPTSAATDALGGGSAKLALLYLSGDRTTGAFVQGKLRDFVKLANLQDAKLTKPPKMELISTDLFSDEVSTAPIADVAHDGIYRLICRMGEAYNETALRGQLSPGWDEWLMGFPIGWTDLSATTLRSLDWSVYPANLVKMHPNYIARVVEGRLPNRKARIKAIGNAQVPLCAAVAFTLLTQRFY
jgi:hypothetical protein